MKFIALILLMVSSISSAYSSEYLIRSEEEFKETLSKVRPGDVVIIANGTYRAWEQSINLEATEDMPVIIKAEHEGKVVFTGEVVRPVFTLTGKYITLSGLVFNACNLVKAGANSGTLITMNNSDFCRVTACVFTENVGKAQFMPLVVVAGGGNGNKVDHCTFENNIDNQDVQVKITKVLCPVNTEIRRNVFKNKKKVSWKDNNGGECVQIGQDPVLLGNKEAFAIVSENRFVNCNAEAEVVSNKSSRNKYIKNFFSNCSGELVMRGGHDCVIDSNVFEENRACIRINGTGHKVTNNEILGAQTAIRLMYGMAKGKEETGFYIAASDCYVKDNTIKNTRTGILVGDSKDTDFTGKFDQTKYPSSFIQNVSPFNNQIGDNTFVQVSQKILIQ